MDLGRPGRRHLFEAVRVHKTKRIGFVPEAIEEDFVADSDNLRWAPLGGLGLGLEEGSAGCNKVLQSIAVAAAAVVLVAEVQQQQQAEAAAEEFEMVGVGRSIEKSELGP